MEPGAVDFLIFGVFWLGGWYIFLCGLVLLHRGWRRSQTRGVSADGLHCAACRFDVRGGTRTECSECGADLTRPAGPGFPRGGIVVKGLHPPISRGLRTLLYFVVFAPLAGFVITMTVLALPINYLTYTGINVQPIDPRSTSTLYGADTYFEAVEARSWSRPSAMERVQCVGLDYTTRVIHAGDKPDEIQRHAEETWDAVLDENPWIDGQDDPDAYRAEYIDLFNLICRYEIAEVVARAELYDVYVYSFREIRVHEASTLAGFVVFLVALILIVVLGDLHTTRSRRRFVERVDQVQARYAQVIKQNREGIEGGQPSGPGETASH